VVSVAGTLNYGTSTMTVANLGATPLAVGDTFAVFNKAGAGSVTVVPPPGASMSFNESTGILTVDSVVPPDPGTLEFAVSGNVIEFNWTNIAAGLEFQTNGLSTGLSTNWVPYPDPSNPVSVTNDGSIPASFFRLSIP
jgi:hypothetical protein